MVIQQRPSPNRNQGRSGWVPDLIVCHTTEGAFDGAVSWITNPASSVSYHFVVVKDGRIVQSVPITDTAWANGTTNSNDARDNRHSRLQAVRERRTNANAYTISIGFEGRSGTTNGNLTPEQLNATVDLIQHIKTEVQRIYGTEIPNNRESIVGHNDIAPRWKPNCPGQDFPFNEVIERLRGMEKMQGNTKFNIFGENVSLKNHLIDGASFVETRRFAEALGLQVDWDSESGTVIIPGRECEKCCGVAEAGNFFFSAEFFNQITPEMWGRISTILNEVT